jgi:phosphatidylglycerophosphate synthase
MFMDELDGALARRYNRITRFGNVLEYVADTVSFCGLFIGAGFGARHLLGGWVPILGVAAAAALLSMRLRMGMEDRHGRSAVFHPRLGPFEFKDGIYLISPVMWAGALDRFFSPRRSGPVSSPRGPCGNAGYG